MEINKEGKIVTASSAAVELDDGVGRKDPSVIPTMNVAANTMQAGINIANATG